MTAEIAIINKAAAVLAADSAVTITVGGSEKIYNTVNKIFDLKMGCPLGIMIYGSLDFMGIPFETLIKTYRKERSEQSFSTVREAFEDFLAYLTNYEFEDRDELLNVSSILHANFREIHEGFYQELLKSMSNKTNAFTTQVNKVLTDFASKRLKYYKKQKRCSEFSLADEQSSVTKYAVLHDEVISNTFRGLKLFSKTADLLRELSGVFLTRLPMSPRRSGIVIVGFGSSQLFPALHAVEIDGIVLGKLRYSYQEDLVIERMGDVRAGIIPFAQKEMVERFLKGVDPDFEKYSFSQFGSLLEAVGRKLIQDNFSGVDAEKQKLIQNFEIFSHEALRELREKTDEYKERAFRQKVLDMVLFMPKQELANMAESLINLTSLKRRVSAERETVGGPVDVAVISKDEGFVWIKRKHYFSPELNPRYIAKLRNGIGDRANGIEQQ